MRKLRSEHQQEMISIQAKLASKSQDNFQWKKDGNRKQFEVMQKIVEQAVQSRALYQTAGQSAGESQLSALIVTAQERIKLLKIADSSPHGWGTVAEYEANPITQGEEDDKKLKKAEKAAQEKSALRLQERQAKQARFSRPGQGNNYQNNNYRNQYGGQNNNSPNYRAYGGFKNGNPYKPSTVTQDKNPPRRNVNNDICYACGSRGHWANACPDNKKTEPEEPKVFSFLFSTGLIYLDYLQIGFQSSFSAAHIQPCCNINAIY